jgi:predicted nucleotidyltransferase
LIYRNLTFLKESDIVLQMRSTSGQQGHLRYPLNRLVGSPGTVRVLRVLADGATSSATQIAAAAGLTPQGARLVLDVLQELGIVSAQGSARTQLFSLADVHPFKHAILELFNAERAAWENVVGHLRQRLKKRTGVQAAWLYGSVARGEDTPVSDIDLALLVSSHGVGDKVREDLMPVEDELHVRVSVTALTPADLAALPEDDRWWSEVVRDARVLKGDRPEIEMRGVRKRATAA